MPRVIDCLYLDQPQVAASYLIRDGEHAAFIDNNTNHSVPLLLEALREEGLTPDDVDYLIITHVHLDHAGGTSLLAAACPRAVVLCHPRAERHLTDPSKLIASARVVYGDDAFDQLYGQINPIPKERVWTLPDNATVQLGARTLRFLHTRGHANHHFCVLDETQGDIYTGDAFGLAYPFLQRNGLFVFPSTSPTDFDAEEAKKSVRRIVESGARRAYPTHFGAVTELAAAGAQMIDYLDQSEATLEAAIKSDVADPELKTFCDARLKVVFDRELEKRSLKLSDGEQAFLHLDRDLNAQGIAYVAQKKRKELRGG